MPTTMKLIAKAVIGGGASSIEFTNIPGTYTDLLVTASLRSDRSADTAQIQGQINGSTANLSCRTLRGDGAFVNSNNYTYLLLGTIPADNLANMWGTFEWYIPNYAASTNKSMSITSNWEQNVGAGPEIFAIAGLWSSTSAITSLKVLPNTGTGFRNGSSIYLYGITKA